MIAILHTGDKNICMLNQGDEGWMEEGQNNFSVGFSCVLM